MKKISSDKSREADSLINTLLNESADSINRVGDTTGVIDTSSFIKENLRFFRNGRIVEPEFPIFN